MNITAVVLSPQPYTREFEGLQLLLHRRVVTDRTQMQRARLEAVAMVRTPHFFFLDDDDDLPSDYLDVLARCLAADAALAYTDELIRRPDGSETTRLSAPYSQDAHLHNPLLVHHLALCRTRLAQAARLPRGPYWAEMLLFWELAKHGAAYVPGVGYVWNAGDGGVHTRPDTMHSQMRSALWCKAHP